MRNFFYKNLLLISLFTINQIFAQTESLLDSEVIPPSPEASSLGKYGDYPVGFYTGVPNISVPFYTITSGKIQVPVTLNYHAGGVKVEEVPSRVGLGWSLSAGGAVTRSIRGGAKDENPYVEWNYQVDGPDDYQTAFSVGYFNRKSNTDFFENKPNEIDKELDLYFYNMPGGSGKILFPKHDKPVFHPFKSYLVSTPFEGTTNITMNDTKGFEITDENGLVYKFKETEVTMGLRTTSEAGYNTSTTIVNYISSWYLSQIYDPVNHRSVYFDYDELGEIEYDHNISKTYSSDPGGCSCGTKGGSSNARLKLQNAKVLRKITFDEGYILFNADHERQDFEDDMAITSMQLFDSDGNLIKSMNLDLDYAHQAGKNAPVDKRLYLKGVTEIGTDANVSKTHTFDYYSINSLPARNSVEQDAWGYFNDNNASSLLPKIYIYPNSGKATLQSIKKENGGTSTNTTSGADRSTNPNTIHFGTLQKITYPTGGYTSFVFEPHSFSSDIYQGGGLRIKKKSSFNGTQTYSTEYKYSGGLAPRGLPSLAYLCVLTGYPNSSDIVKSSHNQAVLGKSNGSHVGYDKVEVINTNSSGLENGKVVYIYNQESDEYPDYNEDSSAGSASCVNTIRNNLFNMTYFPNFNYTSREHVRGQLKTESFYKSVDEDYKIVSRNSYSYQEIKKSGTPSYTIKSGFPYVAKDQAARFNVMAEYEIHPHAYLPIEKKEQTYDDEGNLTEYVTTYTYNTSNNLSINSESKDGRYGNTVTTNYYYPFDYSESVYNNMVGLNYVKPVVRRVITEGSNTVDDEKVTYKDWGNNGIYPYQLFKQGFVQTEFKEYGVHGNLAEEKGFYNNDKISYLWNSDKSNPTAQLSNHDEWEDAGVDSYEDHATSSYFSFLGNRGAGGVTGEKHLILTTSPVSYARTWRPFTKEEYIVSYWAKDGVPNLSFSEASNYSFTDIENGEREINGWRYYEKKMKYNGSNPNEEVILYVKGDCKLDELRMYPSHAQMTTYTYKQLVGLTSSCDPNNIVTKYEYDSFGRLMAIIDHRGNVLNKFDYNYGGKTIAALLSANQCVNNGETVNLSLNISETGISNSDLDIKWYIDNVLFAEGGLSQSTSFNDNQAHFVTAVITHPDFIETRLGKTIYVGNSNDAEVTITQTSSVMNTCENSYITPPATFEINSTDKLFTTEWQMSVNGGAYLPFNQHNILENGNVSIRLEVKNTCGNAAYSNVLTIYAIVNGPGCMH